MVNKNSDAKQVFTTGEAAEVCKISQQTIIRCFDSGKLIGFRVPGSRFRRIPRDELMRFIRENKLPIAEFDLSDKEILEETNPLTYNPEGHLHHTPITPEKMKDTLSGKMLLQNRIIKYHRETDHRDFSYLVSTFVDGSLKLAEPLPQSLTTYFRVGKKPEIYVHKHEISQAQTSQLESSLS